MPLDGELRGEISFDLQLPCNNDVLASQVAHTLSLGLPETQARKRLNVIANGPSAKSAPFGSFDGPTLALNGALHSVFTPRGLAPTYWAACDPQALVADFVRDAPEETIYLVASKCHPDVFEALKDRDIRVWHVRDVPVPASVRAPLCCSITMCAMWEMRLAFGFTDLNVWGWDGAYLDGEHHAGDQRQPTPNDVTINYGGEIIEGPDGPEVIGGRNFETTRSWAAETDFAQQFMILADYFDMSLTIHGDGMVAAMQRALVAQGTITNI